MVAIEREGPADWHEVEALFDLCFAPGREALSSYRLRDGVPPVAALCLVARDEVRARDPSGPETGGWSGGELARMGGGAGDASRDGAAGMTGEGSARVRGTLAGAIRCWPVRVAQAPALLLGPVAVHPTRQGEGLGALLIETVCDRAKDAGWSRILLVGDAPYYGRFGFVRLDGVEMPPPTNPDRVLGRDLTEGAWLGVVGPVLRAAC